VRKNFVQRRRDARALVVGREDNAVCGRFQVQAISFQLRDASLKYCRPESNFCKKKKI
jgi:hypothetical protein